MAKSSLEELRGQIAAGEYAVDPGTLAGDVLSKFALVRRIRPLLMEEPQNGDSAIRQERRSRRRGSLPSRALRPHPRTIRKNRPE